jgi:hypothetical protein
MLQRTDPRLLEAIQLPDDSGLKDSRNPFDVALVALRDLVDARGNFVPNKKLDDIVRNKKLREFKERLCELRSYLKGFKDSQDIREKFIENVYDIIKVTPADAVMHVREAVREAEAMMGPFRAGYLMASEPIPPDYTRNYPNCVRVYNAYAPHNV